MIDYLTTMGRAKMRFLLAVLILLLTASARAGDPELAVRLYEDGFYNLSAKVFTDGLEKLKPQDFKRYHRYAVLAFLKSGDYKDLRRLLKLWKAHFAGLHQGERLAVETVLNIKEGRKIEDAVGKPELLTLPIREKVNFFKTISEFPLKAEEVHYLVKLASADAELKGALRDSGFLHLAFERLTQEHSPLADTLFEKFGKWLTTPKERLAYVRYLDRKGDFSSALVEAEKLYRDVPSPSTRLELARALYFNRRYEDALKVLKEPGTEEERYFKAWCLFRLGRVKEIPKVVEMNISQPALPEKLRTLLDFYAGRYNYKALEEFYPELSAKAVIFSFSPSTPKAGAPGDLAYIYYERGMYRKALSTLERALREPAERNSVARSLFILGKLGSFSTDVATAVYAQIMENYQKTPYYREVLVPSAKAYLYSGNAELALKLLNYIASQGRKTEELKELLALAYMAKGDCRKSAKHFLTLKKPSGEAKTFLSYCLYRIGEKKKAYRLLKQLVEKDRIYPEVNGGRLIYLSAQLGRTKELRRFHFDSSLLKLFAVVVEGDVKTAERIFPSLKGREKLADALFLALSFKESSPAKAMSYASFLLNSAVDAETTAYAKALLGYLAYRSGNFEPVLLNDPKFVSYNPENSVLSTESLISKAEEYARTGSYGKAYRLFKLALSRDIAPQSKRELVRRMVEVDMKTGNLARALSDISVLGESPADKDLENYLKYKVHLRLGNLVEAYASASNVKDLRSVPAEERTQFMAFLANYYKLTGESAKALKLLEELLASGELKKVGYDELVNLAIFAEKQGKLKEADALITQALKKAKGVRQKVESLFWKASIQEKLGDHDSAILNYMKIAYRFSGVEPWSSTAIYRTAEILERQGKLKQAVKLYQRVAKLKKGTKEGEAAQERVKSLLQRLGKEEKWQRRTGFSSSSQTE